MLTEKQLGEHYVRSQNSGLQCFSLQELQKVVVDVVVVALFINCAAAANGRRI